MESAADIYANYPTKTYRKITTRPYQQFAIDKAIEHCKTSADPAIMDISVGGGKSLIIAAIAKHVLDKGGRVLVLSTQSIIISQNSEESWGMGIKCSVYSAGLGKKKAGYPLVMASKGTFANAIKKDMEHDGIIQCNEKPAPSEFYGKAFDLVLIDEAHHVDILDEGHNTQYMFIIDELYRRNPKTRILGLTGSPFRGVVPIIGDNLFWKKKIVDISQDYMIDMGFLVPLQFGLPESDGYDLSEFESVSDDGTQDYTKEQMKLMEKKIMSDLTQTERIVIEVVEKTKDRNCVIFTVASKKHGQEVAKHLPKGSYAIITDDLTDRARDAALKKAYDGDIKYLIQQNVLVTGYNNPRADTIVILRKIGSLTLLVQLLGRALRLLKPEQVAQGVKKDCGLVLDYTDTMTEFRDKYDSRVLDDYDHARSKANDDLITCPKCGEENGFHAVRCRGFINGERCDHFWKSRICEPFMINGRIVNHGCGAENAPTARQCRLCENTLIDPNEKLTGTHYKETDYKPVQLFKMIPTKNNGVLVTYRLPGGEVAKKFYNPFSENQIAKRIWRNEFVKNHANTQLLKTKIKVSRNAGELCQLESELDTVEAITHRKNAKNESLIAKYILRSK